MPIEYRRDLTRLLAGFIDAHPGLRPGKIFGVPAGAAGRWFACVFEDGITCRLPPELARLEKRRAARGSAPRSARQRRMQRMADWVFLRPRTRAGLLRLLPLLEAGAAYTARRIAGRR